MDELTHLVDQLKQVEHFKRLSPVDLMVIVTSGQAKMCEPGTTLFFEGDPCAGMYVLLKGKVDLLKTGPEGQVTILNTIRPVIMFNEVPVLDGGVNPVSAVAVEKSSVWHVSCERFQAIIKQYPQLAIGLLKVMARRNRVMMSHYADLSFRSTTARIAKHLLLLSENGNKTINRLSNPIKNMAACVVTAPEAVSRSLKQISTLHLIEVDRKTIRVIDPAGLQQLAEISL
jgi:CRP-like cAMP-binding protein